MHVKYMKWMWKIHKILQIKWKKNENITFPKTKIISITSVMSSLSYLGNWDYRPRKWSNFTRKNIRFKFHLCAKRILLLVWFSKDSARVSWVSDAVKQVTYFTAGAAQVIDNKFLLYSLLYFSSSLWVGKPEEIH